MAGTSKFVHSCPLNRLNIKSIKRRRQVKQNDETDILHAWILNARCHGDNKNSRALA
jgi:hypothetical protein